jgi:hypothetical protein
MRWMLWLKTRHGTRLAVQQQRFECDSNADYKISKVLRRHCISLPLHLHRLIRNHFDIRNS